MKFKTTVIGSFPKPSYLKIPDWFAESSIGNPSKLYNAFIENVDMEEFEDTLETALKDVIEEQINLGIDVITDGEISRENYIYSFCRHLEGIDFEQFHLKKMRNNAIEVECPTIVGPIRWITPHLHEEWKRAQKYSSKPVKTTIPGPMTIADTLVNRYYTTEKTLLRDLSRAIQQEISHLVNAGCRHVQIDEPVLARYPEKAVAYGIKMIDKCLEGLDEFIETILHICCGYPCYLDHRDYMKADPRTYHQLAPYIENSLVKSVSLEYAHTCYDDISYLRHFKKTKVIFGVIAIAKRRVESVEEIRKSVSLALEYLDSPEQLILAPDCGLAMLPLPILREKIKRMVEASQWNDTLYK